MSAGVELLPSPHDRLDPVAAAVRWWTSRLAEIFSRRTPTVVAVADIETDARRRLPASISMALPAEEIFVSQASLPPGGPDAHRKAMALRLAELAPLDPTLLELAARRVRDASNEEAATNGAVYRVAMARADRLAAMEEKAHRRGARLVRFHAQSDDRVWLQTTRARRAQLRARLADMVLVAALAVSAVVAAGAVTRALERQTEALLAADQSARRANVEAERAARDAEVSNAFVARGVLDRRPSAALGDLAALNAATPDGAWWTRVRWTPEEVTLTGAGGQAAEAIEALSAAASGWSIALAGPVRAGDAEGPQTFELRAAKREGDGG